LHGLPAYRGAFAQVIRQSAGIVDRQLRVYLATIAAYRWLSIRLESLAAVMIFGVALLVVATRYACGRLMVNLPAV